MPDVLSVTSTTPTAGTTAATSTATGAGLGSLDKDAFLKLLVAQLKYQNPLSPTDPSQMMAQTAQFTMVESLQKISASQADAGAWQQVIAGQGLIGKQVTGGPSDAQLTGVVTGMTLTADGPVLQLDSGQTLPVASVSHVAAAAAAGAGTTGSPTTGSTTAP